MDWAGVSLLVSGLGAGMFGAGVWIEERDVEAASVIGGIGVVVILANFLFTIFRLVVVVCG